MSKHEGRDGNVGAPGPESVVAVGRRLTKESAQVFARNVALKVVTIVASILLARMLGPAALGLWALVTSTSGWIWILGELGLGTAVVPLAGEAKGEGHVPVGGTALRVGLIAGSVAAVGYGLLSPFLADSLYGEPQARFLFLLSAATLVPLSVSGVLSAVLQAHRRIGKLAVMGLGTGVLSAASLVAGAALGGLTGAFLGALAASSLTAVAFVGLFRMEFPEDPRILRGFDARAAKRLLSLGTLTMVSTFLTLLGPWIALTLLAQTSTVDEVGLYSVAWRVSAFVLFPASAVFVAFFPLASEAYGANPRLFDRTFRETIRYSLIVTWPITAILVLLAPEVTATLYGSAFAPAGVLLAILAAAGFLQAFSGWGSTLFYVSKAMRRGVVLVAAAVGLQIGIAFVAIPAWGPIGLVVSMLALMFATVGLAPAFLRGKPAAQHLGQYSTWAVLLAAAFVALGWAAQPLGLTARLTILAGLLVTFAILLDRVVLTPPDRRFIVGLLKAVFRRA